MSLWTPPPDDSPRRLADLRVSYDAGVLDEGDLRDSPLAQFGAWFDDAVAVGLPEPNAMIVATAGTRRPAQRPDGAAEGRGRARLRLLHEPRIAQEPRSWRRTRGPRACSRGSRCTARSSSSGEWRQIDRDEAQAYFASRPHGSRLGAWASRQSTVIDGRAEVEQRYADLQEQYPEGADVPLPDFWGGWLVRPESVEFWQGRESRLHDRLRFRAVDGGSGDMGDATAWQVERLSP